MLRAPPRGSVIEAAANSEAAREIENLVKQVVGESKRKAA